jgi:hypothetical protein
LIASSETTWLDLKSARVLCFLLIYDLYLSLNSISTWKINEMAIKHKEWMIKLCYVL